MWREDRASHGSVSNPKDALQQDRPSLEQQTWKASRTLSCCTCVLALGAASRTKSAELSSKCEETTMSVETGSVIIAPPVTAWFCENTENWGREGRRGRGERGTREGEKKRSSKGASKEG